MKHVQVEPLALMSHCCTWMPCSSFLCEFMGLISDIFMYLHNFIKYCTMVIFHLLMWWAFFCSSAVLDCHFPILRSGGHRNVLFVVWGYEYREGKNELGSPYWAGEFASHLMVAFGHTLEDSLHQFHNGSGLISHQKVSTFSKSTPIFDALITFMIGTANFSFDFTCHLGHSLVFYP